MMNFLIADDELLVRINVQKALNDLGITNENIYCANCGKQVLEIVQETPIQIAFIDIRMPDISGLEAIRACLSLSPETSWYVLTGFEKFEYAAEAIHLGVKDFLLKPLNLQTLAKILEKEQAMIKIEETNRRNFYVSEIAGILFGGNKSKIREDLSCLPCYCTLDNEMSDHMEIPDFEILHQIEYTHPAVKAVILPMDGFAYITFVMSSKHYITAILSDIRELLRQMMSQKGYEGTTCFYCHTFIPLSCLQQTFDTLKEYSAIRAINGMNRLYQFNSFQKFSGQRGETLASLLCSAPKAFFSNSYVEFTNLLPKLLAEMKKTNACENPKWLDHINRFIALSLPIPDKKLTNIDEFSAYFQRLASMLLLKTEDNEFTIAPLLSYVDEHFAEDISIPALASLFRVSPNYLSTRFKKDVGIRFTDYITNLRMAKARQLLIETNLQVKEIATRVGYFTTSHFIRTFVKHEGITPSEYRNQNS